MLSTRFFRFEASNIQVTRFAAIQFVMMQAMTSLMFNSAFSVPGIMPQSAPAAMPPKNASSQMIQTGILSGEIESAINSVAAVPIRY